MHWSTTVSMVADQASVLFVAAFNLAAAAVESNVPSVLSKPDWLSMQPDQQHHIADLLSDFGH
jgi:hypothetical protein